MSRQTMPPAEVEISADLVRQLLSDQHPDLAHLPLEAVGGGWDNALFRLGDAFAVRLPRRAVAAPLIEHEQRWLPQLAPRLPLAVPVIERVGRPGHGYPWTWGIARWIDGTNAVRFAPLTDPSAARTLGAFLRALHTPAPFEAPISEVRGVPLAARTGRMFGCVDELGALIDRRRVIECWEHALEAAPWSAPPVWIHGDLHPANVIMSKGQVAAVIDFGDLSQGDPATDIAAAWMLFAPDVRRAFREAAGPTAADGHTWRRARCWALTLNLAWLMMSVDDEETTKQALETIERVVGDKDE